MEDGRTSKPNIKEVMQTIEHGLLNDRWQLYVGAKDMCLKGNEIFTDKSYLATIRVETHK